MIDDNLKSNSTFFFPFLSSKSNEGPLMLSRENSFFDTKFTSNEFQLQYNKNFSSKNTIYDSKFNQMITKTNNTNVLKKTEAVINSIENQKIKTTDLYKKISDCLFDILFITSNPPNDKEDYLRALQFQQILIDLMIQFVNSKVNSVQE